MADDFFDDQDPFFLASDRLDAGESPRSVYLWAKASRAKVRDKVAREQWDEMLRYIAEEYPDANLR